MSKWCAYLATIVVPVGAVGCGDSSEDRALGELRRTLAVAQELSYRGHLDMKLDTKQEGRFALAGEIVADDSTSQNRFRGNLIASLKKIPFEWIMDGDRLWYRSPAFAGQLPPGKTWIATSSGGGGAGPTITPGELTRLVREAGEAEDLGTSRTGGRELDHLRATIDLTELAEDAEGSFARSLQNLGDAADAPLVIDVWADEDSRPTKMTVRIDVPASASGRPQFVKVEALFREWEVPVRATPPPEREVISEAAAGI